MSTKQSAEKRGTKRSLNDIIDANDNFAEPNAKRRKITPENNSTEIDSKRKITGKLAAKYAHLNFDPTKMKPNANKSTTIPKKDKSEKKEMDQSLLLNKPTIPEVGRRKRTKKKIQMDENQKENQNENQNQNEIPQNIKNMISNKIKNEISNIRYLEPDRVKIYALKNELIQTANRILSVEYIENKETFEKIIAVNNSNELCDICVEDKITMDTMAISECIEYTFNENGQWFVGEITFESLQYYKQSKFNEWLKQITKPVCEAAFKRLLRNGLITKIFDRFVFMSPENEKHEFIIRDSKGKTVNIPRPVYKLRKWNVEKRKYENIDAHLKGAPNENDAKEYWEKMIGEFRVKHGNEYINNLLASFKSQK